MIKEKGARATFSKLLSEETLDARVQSMRVPDWVLVLFKLKSRISDKGWQDFINLTKLGRTAVSYGLSYILWLLMFLLGAKITQFKKCKYLYYDIKQIHVAGSCPQFSWPACFTLSHWYSSLDSDDKFPYSNVHTTRSRSATVCNTFYRV